MSAQQALPGAESAVERDPLDFNRTPAWVVELLMPYLGQPRTVLDVGCGDGAIGRVLRWWLKSSWIEGVEVDHARGREARDAGRFGGAPGPVIYNDVRIQSWLEDGIWVIDGFRPDQETLTHTQLIISNPPFGLAALDFLRRDVKRVAPGGTVAFLLPAHWDHDPDVESEFARQRFLDSLRLPDGREGYCKLAIVGGGPYPARPSFKKGGTASDRYAWFMFGDKWAGQPSRRIHAIPPEEHSTQLSLLGTK